MAKRTLTSIEIPQADSLENVRRVVEAIASGSSSRKEIAEKTDISLRHIDYAIHAAKSLGFLAAGDALSISDSGAALVATTRGTSEEREALKAAIKVNDVVQQLAPDLLDETAPTKAALTARIQDACPDLSEATAARRAQTLLAWRSQALSTQLSLPLDAPEAAPPAEKKAPAPKKAAEKKPVAKKAAAKPAAKKAAKVAKKPAAKKAAAKPAAKAAKKPAAKAAKKPAAKKAAKAAKKPAAAKKAAPAAASAESSGSPPPAAAPEAAPAREVTYEMDEA